jgi:hypothetical protein
LLQAINYPNESVFIVYYTKIDDYKNRKNKFC